MQNSENRNLKIFNMVEEELHAIHEVKDASIGINEFNKVKILAPKHDTVEPLINLL